MKKTEIPEMYKLNEAPGANGIYIMENIFNDYKSHRHDFYEFEYIIEGEGRCEINGKSFLFRKGDISFVTPMDLHSYESEETFKTVTVHFYLDILDRELSVLSEMDACVLNCTEEMKELFMLISGENIQEKYRGLSLRNLLELIVIMFLRTSKCEKKSDMPKEIIDVVGYVNRNFTKHIDLKSTSEKYNYSLSYLSRQFKKYTGKGFIEYLTDVRVSHAKNILLDRDISITQLSYECGFGSIRSLNRAFLEKYGCSPKEYKRQNLS